MKSSTLHVLLNRSADSERFEALLRPTALPGILPRVSDIDFHALSDLMPWMGMLRPDARDRTLKITMAGCGFTEVQGHSLIGMDYLDFVDPAVKGEAFDSSFVMMGRPSGLWQLAPVRFFDDSEGVVEFTGCPVFDDTRGCGMVLFLIRNTSPQQCKIMTVRRALVGRWLEMR